MKLKKLVLAVFCCFFFKFCFSELTSLTCSFQNVSYSRPISKNLMEGHCLLIKRSPGQYMYIIYLTFFLTKDESQSQSQFLYLIYIFVRLHVCRNIWKTQIYTNYFFDMKTRLSNNGKLSDTRVPEIWTFLLCFLHHLL